MPVSDHVYRKWVRVVNPKGYESDYHHKNPNQSPSGLLVHDTDLSPVRKSCKHDL